MGTSHQYTVERLIKKLRKMDKKLKVTVGDAAGTSCGKIVGCDVIGGECAFEYYETMHEGEKVG